MAHCVGPNSALPASRHLTPVPLHTHARRVDCRAITIACCNRARRIDKHRLNVTGELFEFTEHRQADGIFSSPPDEVAPATHEDRQPPVHGAVVRHRAVRPLGLVMALLAGVHAFAQPGLELDHAQVATSACKTHQIQLE